MVETGACLPQAPTASNVLLADPVADFLCCCSDPAFFTARYVQIYDATNRVWLPFTLWPAQYDILDALETGRKLVVLKARQLGISWLSLAYALWLLQCRAPATVLLFSLREAEAKDLLWRLKGMYERLPNWLQARAVTKDNENRWELSNGSRALAFSTKGGRSYTGTFALVDEADFVPDLAQFLNAVKPTLDAGGQLCMVSTSDKRHPVSTFKNLFRASLQGTGDYRHVFLPWHARPDRDEHWHTITKAEMYAQRGTDDDFFAEYPATPEEALAPEELDRRLPFSWLEGCLDTQASWEGSSTNLDVSHPASPSLSPTSPLLGVVVHDATRSGALFPWMTARRWKKWALHKYRTWRSAYQRARRMAQVARLAMQGVLTMAQVFPYSIFNVRNPG